MSNLDYAYQVHKLKGRMGTKIACIIPAFNEGSRISKVLEVVINFPAFDEIILVNDGSSDNTLDIMNYYAKLSSSIKVIDVQPNGGKTNAVKQGIKASDSDMVCLIDADLIGLRYDYIYKMIFFLLTGDFDMTILDRAGDRVSPVGWVQSWTARFNGGERAMWRKDFDKVKFGKESKYGIEQELNLYYVDNSLKVRTIYCPELYCTYQFEKKGWIEGFKAYKKMFTEIYLNSRVKGFYIQVENIVEDRIEPLYKIMDKSYVKTPVVGAILAAGLVTSVATFLWLNLKNNAEKIKRFRD